MVRGIRELMTACGSSKHDIVVEMINALIDQYVNTTSGIIGVGIRYVNNREHVAIRLKGVIRNRWSKDNDGIYHNLF